jgi:hypothetical protein
MSIERTSAWLRGWERGIEAFKRGEPEPAPVALTLEAAAFSHAYTQARAEHRRETPASRALVSDASGVTEMQPDPEMLKERQP